MTNREINQEEKNKWDDFIKNLETSHIFQTYQWGEFKLTQGWKPRRIVLEENEKIKAAFPILERKIPLLGFKFWYLPRGPVLDFQNNILVDLALENLLNLAKDNKVIAVKISPEAILNENSAWIIDLLKKKEFQETAKYQLHKCTIRLNIKKNLEDIFNTDFKKNTRWEIKRAEKDGVKVKKGETEKDLKIFYQLYCEALKRSGVGILPYNFFQNFWRFFKKEILLLIAFYRNIPVSGIFVLSFNKKSWYLFGGSTRKYPTHYSSQLLHWEVIKLLKNQNCDIYDFQGIPCGEPKNNHDAGVLQFKCGFGGKRIELVGEFDYIFSPTLYKLLLNYIYPLYQRIRNI